MGPKGVAYKDPDDIPNENPDRAQFPLMHILPCLGLTNKLKKFTSQLWAVLRQRG